MYSSVTLPERFSPSGATAGSTTRLRRLCDVSSRTVRAACFCGFAGVLSVAALTAAESAHPSQLHSVLDMPLGAQPLRVHRFRLPLAGLHAEVVDLAYERPVVDALGNADVVVNGGYWGWTAAERRTLIGLVSANGKQWSPLRNALNGGVLVVHGGKASIAPSRGYQGPDHPDLAIQCSPRLVAAGAVVDKLNTHSRAARTAVCVRDSGATLDIYVTDPDQLGPSLHDLAEWLLRQGCEHALNLDGGPSTAAAFHEAGHVVRIGPGVELPYALRFRYTSR
jgi:hypothetical protein